MPFLELHCLSLYCVWDFRPFSSRTICLAKRNGILFYAVPLSGSRLPGSCCRTGTVPGVRAVQTHYRGLGRKWLKDMAFVSAWAIGRIWLLCLPGLWWGRLFIQERCWLFARLKAETRSMIDHNVFLEKLNELLKRFPCKREIKKIEKLLQERFPEERLERTAE